MRFVPVALIGLVVASSAWARDSDKSLSASSVRQQPRIQQASASLLSAQTPLKASPNSNRIVLTWSNVSGETGYIVERRAKGKQFAEIAKTTTDVNTYTDTLTTSGIYQYRVRAYDASAGMTYSRYSNTTFTNARAPKIRSTTPTSTTGSTTPTSTTPTSTTESTTPTTSTPTTSTDSTTPTTSTDSTTPTTSTDSTTPTTSTDSTTSASDP